MKKVCFGLLQILIPILIFLLQAADMYSYSLRQFSSRNGLSNSAILSICQDNSGVMWFGSCDGLNIFDGTTLRLYQPTSIHNTLSGNLIDNIMEADDNVLWIQTNYGLERFDTRSRIIKSFKDFRDACKMTRSQSNDIYILKDDGWLYYYKEKEKTFQKLDMERVSFENVKQIAVDKSNVLWIFATNGETRSYTLSKADDCVKLTPCHYFEHSETLRYIFAEEGVVYFVDNTCALYEYDLQSRKEYYIADLENEIRNRGEISSIIKKENDYFIGFKSSGLIELKYQPEQKVKFVKKPIDINSGIFCLVKDKFQDIIWVGTDGQGVYMYYNDTYSIKNTLLDTPDYRINNPVRALYLDDEWTLWIATKGDGILRLTGYVPGVNTSSAADKIQTGNSVLTDNSVYCFAPSRWKRLWVGTEGGMNYYSYAEQRMKEFPVIADGKIVKYVHSIREQNDSTLWVSTVGEGIVKIMLSVVDGVPTVVSAKRFVLDGGRKASNYFFTSYVESDSIIWFGNRGLGAYRMNTLNETMKPCRFEHNVGSQTVNDIFAILKNEGGYWFGTSFGLTRFYDGKRRVYNEMDGFPNNTVHGILEDGIGNLWLSTNQGLVRFNMQGNTVQTYRNLNALEVTEFSDGAFFKDRRTGTLFFGGTNGFVTVNVNNQSQEEYMPVLHFNHLAIFGKEYNINNFFHFQGKREILELDYDQNFFSISFAAIDYINGSNYTYFYKIDGLSQNWVENGRSNIAVFSNLAPGQYNLLVKYRSNITGKESEPQVLIIRIMPPWYMTKWAYAIYFLFLSGLIVWCIYLLRKKYQRKRDIIIERMNRQQRDELYESKLRFFTNITHEFCTPLTLISGPCEKILAYPGTDSYLRKYAAMIQQNATRLNALILELIEFRRLETGHKVLEIRDIEVSEQTLSIAESFLDLAESRQLDYRLKIEENIHWNSDLSCLNKIVNNLISNAFKYTSEKGTITVELFVKEELLCIRISNTGKGIEKENLEKIFDRYKILDGFEMQNDKGISPRNGLGLAICHSMVNLLEGRIRVTSVLNEVTTFEVTLPMLSVTTSASEEKEPVDLIPLSDEKVTPLINEPDGYDLSKQVIMIIDDEPSMLWFVFEVFAAEYNVLPFSNAEEALERLKLNQPDLIISDVMMPGMDGMSFAKRIKSDKQLSHIPLVLLSALNNMDEQVKGIDAGAEAYVTKPFNVEYLEKIVKRLIKRKDDLREYYNSAYSSYELDDGHFVHKEDKQFFEKMMQIIDEQIRNPELSVELLSHLLGYGTRQFYRKLKSITEKSPADIIKEYRLSVAERLLISTNLTVEEIMDQAGFMNRGTFYKIFSLKHEMSPRQFREQKKKEVSGL